MAVRNRRRRIELRAYCLFLVKRLVRERRPLVQLFRNLWPHELTDELMRLLPAGLREQLMNEVSTFK
jgi:hypothetical protein